MEIRRSLRVRVASAFALFGGSVALALAIILFFTAHNLNQRLIDESLQAELEDYMSRRTRNPQSLPPTTVSVRGFVATTADKRDIPPILAKLPPGSHEIILDEIFYHAAVADRNGSRYYMLFNEARQQNRERRFLLVLGGGMLIMIMFSAVGGWWLAGRVTSPVTALARRVSEASSEGEMLALDKHLSEDEVGALAHAFEHYATRLNAFFARERDFTADVSHELRTPLAVIQGAAEVLQADDRLNDWQMERLDRIERAARETSGLIAALLSLARESTDDATRADCDVAAVAREAVEKHRYLLRKDTRIELEIQSEPTLAVEKVLLAIVMDNLVRNALSFTEAGEVKVRVEATQVIVTDTGRGIGAEEMGRIFQRHYKGSGSQGVGIGLSLVKRICDRYGWEIAIESREGEGTVAALIFAAT
jgi:signal transduction histidine kinase